MFLVYTDVIILPGMLFQEAGILSIGVLGLLVSTGATAAQPLFFGKVLDAATHSMGESDWTVLIY